ncbi:MAG: cob(I)yrinic acid a,c-diamide adenosyltransferase [Planctomycetota bacterium]
MRIYTKQGDTGQTDLSVGPRVSKSHARIEACGSVDELSAALGLALAPSGDQQAPAWVRESFVPVQRVLFELGADLANPEVATGGAAARVQDADVGWLEGCMDAADHQLPPLRKFILPGGSEAGARLHLARTVCRRAERAVVALADQEPLPDIAVRYLNRLSDLLFVAARAANQSAGVEDVTWDARPAELPAHATETQSWPLSG